MVGRIRGCWTAARQVARRCAHRVLRLARRLVPSPPPGSAHEIRPAPDVYRQAHNRRCNPLAAVCSGLK
eukprot:1911165-Alexandrium_andersonii.AAC.1